MDENVALSECWYDVAATANINNILATFNQELSPNLTELKNFANLEADDSTADLTARMLHDFDKIAQDVEHYLHELQVEPGKNQAVSNIINLDLIGRGLHKISCIGINKKMSSITACINRRLTGQRKARKSLKQLRPVDDEIKDREVQQSQPLDVGEEKVILDVGTPQEVFEMDFIEPASAEPIPGTDNVTFDNILPDMDKSRVVLTEQPKILPVGVDLLTNAREPDDSVIPAPSILAVSVPFEDIQLAERDNVIASPLALAGEVAIGEELAEDFPVLPVPILVTDDVPISYTDLKGEGVRRTASITARIPVETESQPKIKHELKVVKKFLILKKASRLKASVAHLVENTQSFIDIYQSYENDAMFNEVSRMKNGHLNDEIERLVVLCGSVSVGESLEINGPDVDDLELPVDHEKLTKQHQTIINQDDKVPKIDDKNELPETQSIHHQYLSHHVPVHEDEVPAHTPLLSAQFTDPAHTPLLSAQFTDPAHTPLLSAQFTDPAHTPLRSAQFTDPALTSLTASHQAQGGVKEPAPSSHQVQLSDDFLKQVDEIIFNKKESKTARKAMLSDIVLTRITELLRTREVDRITFSDLCPAAGVGVELAVAVFGTVIKLENQQVLELNQTDKEDIDCIFIKLLPPA